MSEIAETEGPVFSDDFIAGFKQLMAEATKDLKEARHAFEQFFEGEDWDKLRK